MAQRNPAWFTDPSDPRLARWHDGGDWTDFTMVVAEWTSPEPPPPPAGWSPTSSPTAGLVPAFGAAAPVPPAPAPVTPDPEPTREAEAEAEPQPAPPAPGQGLPSSPAPGDDAPRGLARLTELAERAGDRPSQSGVRISAPVAEPEPAPTPAFQEPSPEPAPPVPEPTTAPGEASPTPAFRADPPPPPTRPSSPGHLAPPEADDVEDKDATFSGHGPEAPGPDWGGGIEAPRPQRRPSGWSDDPDELPDAPLTRRGLLDTYRWAPLWVRIALPLALLAVVALVVLQVAGGDDDGGTANPFGNGDGTLEQAAANEPGMADAVEAARATGIPEAISDNEVATLVKGVCSAARRSLVPLDLSRSLADSGVDATTLSPAATSIGKGALEFCPDQENAVPQVVSKLVARTERMLESPAG